MQDGDWLETLKVGDQVCYYSQYHGYVFEVIEKITPTGQIKTRHRTFKNGSCKVDSWTWYTLVPITQDILDTERARDLRRKLSEFKFMKLNLEELEQIYALIEGFDFAAGLQSNE